MNVSQNKDSKFQAYVFLHTVVILWGFTAVLGRAISVSGPATVWWRMGLTTVSLLALPGIFAQLKQIPRSTFIKLLGIGVLVALHWVAFFSAIKLSNVSVALSGFATAAFFTSLLEPLILRTKFKKFEVLLGLLVVGGIYLIFRFAGDFFWGITVGVISGFLGGLFSVFNKQMVENHPPQAITLLELGSGFLFVSPLVFGYHFYLPDEKFMLVDWDWLWMGLLAFVCTTFAFILGLRALKSLTPFTFNLTINLEPIYGFVLAWLIFAENKEVTPGFYLGAALVISSVFLHPLLARRFGDQDQEVSRA